jgi:uncharacterized protein YrrD
MGGLSLRFTRDITGLPVIHAASGRELGKVREWLLDEQGQSVVAFLAEGSGWLPQRRLFTYDDIQGLGSDAVLVKQEGKHPEGDPPRWKGKGTTRVLGLRVLSNKGTELGVVDDILIEEDTGRVTGWRLSSGLIDDILEGRQIVELPPLISISDERMIIQE